MSEKNNVELDGHNLTLENIWEVAYGASAISIAPRCAQRLQDARTLVDNLAQSGKPIYGINTGFGFLAETPISDEKLGLLQHNLIVSHAVGVAAPLEPPLARALMLLRANTLAVGHSGCRPLILENLVQLLNAGCAPFVPRKGSVGASGDLAPLAHVALLLLGEGNAFVDGKETTAAQALAHAGLTPIQLAAKEGLALINGTQAMTAVATMTLLEAERLCALADVVGACSLEALMGTNKAFAHRVHAARPHPGQVESAQNLRLLLNESEILESHKDCGKVQDPYSLRCMPQVHGASRDALLYVRQVLEREINSATDNPLVFLDGDFGDEGDEIISGGNFHGQPIALALDFLAIAVAELANISERRVEQLVNPTLSAGLPAFLAEDAGLNSGYMILQVTAASLINENKILCHPASVDSIPSSANREDHVSMGMTSANKAREVMKNVRHVMGIEALAACQALDFRHPLKPGKGVAAVHQKVREKIPFAKADRWFKLDMDEMEKLMADDTLLVVAESACGSLN
ncbi:MAG: histidine ammonia-lyase [Myxococcales bacterium]|nr:histidine ammonia-lyase [Myxococcales bacterium]